MSDRIVLRRGTTLRKAGLLGGALRNGTILAPLVLLAGCGGSGGGGGIGSTPTPPSAQIPDPIATPAPVPTPVPTPAPTPAPTPTPTSVNYDTAEYRATVGAVSMNALSGYSRGATGAGIGIGIVDTGIDLQSEEFTGRTSSASAPVAGNDSVDDEDGHGTAVAFTAAGRRNGAGSHGVAFDATVIALRADRPGSCATENASDADSGCKFGSDAIARGVDAARTAGARVINLSLGGTSMPVQLQNAIGRATAAGIVVVISAGNDAADNPDSFAAVATNTAVSRGLVIVAGSVGSGDAISSFSDRAGSGAAYYLAAVGERVRAPDETNTPYLWSGTSFAAPQISGAVALLAQAFPNLSGSQIVQLLFQTARDAGATGVDPVYGNGIIDLTRAFQPVGSTSVAGTGTAVSMMANATLSAPMGDARTTQLGAVILDGFDRAFAIDLAGTIARTSPAPRLAGALRLGGRQVAAAMGGTTVSMTLAPRLPGGAPVPEATRLSLQDATAARAIAGTVTQWVGSTLSFGFAFAQGAGSLVAQLTGQHDPAFLVADPRGLGFDGAARNAGAVRQRIAGIGLTAAIENGVVRQYRDLDLRPDPRFSRLSLTLDRRLGPVALAIAGERLDERETVLGASFDAGLGAARAISWFASLDARLDAGNGWTLGGSMRHGWTQANIRAGLRGDGIIRTGAYAVDLGKAGLFGGDSIGLRIAQPLRVASGGLDIALPTWWDYATRSVGTYTTQRLNLAPAGREVDVEARYARILGPGTVQTNLFWRRDPGNIADLADDYGMALRYSLGF